MVGLHEDVMHSWIMGLRRMRGFELAVMMEQRKDELLTGMSLVHCFRKRRLEVGDV